MTDALPRIGFVGLGAMGHPMVARLAAAGYPMLVRDADPATAEAVAAEIGATVAMRSSDFSGVDVVILMLPNSTIVESVLKGADGLVSELRPGALIIDMSSSEPLRTQLLALELTAAGLAFCDAPVSGGPAGVERGSLAIMIGGEDSTVARAMPIFQVLGKRVVQVGPIGAGHAAKALNNLVSAATLAVTVEALHAAQAFGIDPAVFTDVLNGATGRSNTSENKVRQFMLSGTWGSGFALALMVKDLGIAVDLLDGLDQPAPIAHETVDVWRKVAPLAPPGTDHTRMYEYLAPPSGTGQE